MKIICYVSKHILPEKKVDNYGHINHQTRPQLDYVLINKKWINSAKNGRAYNSFISVSSDHRIVTANIQLTLRANTK